MAAPTNEVLFFGCVMFEGAEVLRLTVWNLKVNSKQMFRVVAFPGLSGKMVKSIKTLCQCLNKLLDCLLMLPKL